MGQNVHANIAVKIKCISVTVELGEIVWRGEMNSTSVQLQIGDRQMHTNSLFDT
jgi:hypothetical protein